MITTEHKIIAALAVLLLGALAAGGAGYRYHLQTTAALTQTAKSEAASASSYRVQAEGLSAQVNGLKVELTKRDESQRNATHTAKRRITTGTGAGQVVEESETTDTLQESDRHFLQMAAEQLALLQARASKSELAAATATASAEILQQRLDKQELEISKSAPRWEMAVEIAPRVLGWDPLNTAGDPPRMRAEGSVLIGPYSVGLNFAPAFATDKLDPLLRAAIRF